MDRYKLIPVAAAAFMLFALVLAPARIVDFLLPAVHFEYRASLIIGMWILKCALALDALLLLFLPRATRFFMSYSAMSDGDRIGGRPTVTRSEWLLVIAATVLAFLIRIIRVSAGFGYDEIFFFESFMTKSPLAVLARAEPWRALYGLLGNLSCHLLQPSEIAARIPALLFGVISVPAIYIFVRRCAGRWPGILAALLLCVSTFHVWYSQDASGYSMALFFSIMASWTFGEAIALFRNRETRLNCDVMLRRPWLAWGFSAFFAIYSQWYVGGLLVASQAFFLLLLVVAGKRSLPDLMRTVVILIYVAAAVLTVSAITLPRQVMMFTVWGSTEMRGPLYGNLVFFGEWLFQTYAEPLSRMYYALLFMAGVFLYARRFPGRALYVLLPIAIMLAHWGVSEHKIICARYGILALIPVVAFAAFALTWIGAILFTRWRGRYRCLGVALTVLVSLPLLWGTVVSLRTYLGKDRYPIRVAARFMESHAAPNEPAFFGGFGFDKFSFYCPRLRYLADYSTLRAELGKGTPLWLVYWFPSYFDGMPEDLRHEVVGRGELRLKYVGFRQSYLESDYGSYCWRIRGDGGQPVVDNTRTQMVTSGREGW